MSLLAASGPTSVQVVSWRQLLRIRYPWRSRKMLFLDFDRLCHSIRRERSTKLVGIWQLPHQRYEAKTLFDQAEFLARRTTFSFDKVTVTGAPLIRMVTSPLSSSMAVISPNRLTRSFMVKLLLDVSERHIESSQ